MQDSPEFQRILKLRRRDWEVEAKHNDLYKRMSQAFKLPRGTQELWLEQAAALADAHDQKGGIFPLGVSDGKTLVSYLLPVVLLGIKRPLLLIPAALDEKTWREFKGYQQDWLCHPAFSTRERFNASFLSYQKLSRDSSQDILNRLRPDMIIADEAHFAANRNASCTRRIERFMLANPETVFCAMSGTITKRSIGDYWHLMFWALRERMPLPRTEAEMLRWAEALDERKVDAVSRRAPGVLLQLCTEEERQKAIPQRSAPIGRTQQMPIFQFTETLTAARLGYQRRLTDTPGIVCSSDKKLACSLVIRRLEVDPGLVVQEHLTKLRQERLTPNGTLLATPRQVWACARQIACGFFYKWSPPAPMYWLTARNKWNWYVREILTPGASMHVQYQHLNLDSPFQVAKAVAGPKAVKEKDDGYSDAEDAYDEPEEDGDEEAVAPEQQVFVPKIADAHIQEAYREWTAVRKDFKINTVAEWLSDSTINYCVDWVKKNGPGIIWTDHRAFGIKLAERLGTGFCSRKGLDANKVLIDDYKGKTVVASVAANKEGRNLQYDWNKNLIVTVMPTGRIIQQLLGRTHRKGQKADTVYVDWIAACEEQDQGFRQMMSDAKYIQETLREKQKLLYADHV